MGRQETIEEAAIRALAGTTSKRTNGTKTKLINALITIAVLYLGALSYRVFIVSATQEQLASVKSDMTCALEKIDKKLDTLIWYQIPKKTGGHD